MARGEWGPNGRCSYKRATFIVCSINVVVAVYVFRSLYASLYMYPLPDAQTSIRYTADQIRKMEESYQIRKAAEPTELIELVIQLKKRVIREDRVVELPQYLRRKLVDELLNRLKSMTIASNSTEQREVVEIWRKEKLKEAKKLIRGKAINSTFLPEEAGIVARALKSDWAVLEDELGLWIPVEIINREHDDKRDDEEEDLDKEVLPGRQLPSECNAELHTDYGGAAVRWGLTHHKESAYDCCMACLDQAKRAKPGQRKCNIWVYCPSESGCYSPDIYQHKNQECWLKYSETPKANFKDRYPESYRDSHPNAPVLVPWVSGVV